MTSWIDRAKTREFQIWEYHASHGSLLVRSPKGNGFSSNLDLQCFGVAYIELPRVFTGLTFADPNVEETAKVTRALATYREPWTLRILVSGGLRYAIAATQFVEQENEKEAMTSFLATRLRAPTSPPTRVRRPIH